MLTDGSELGAWARALPEADYIILPVGAIEALTGCFFGLLAMPEFLPGLGDSKMEQTHPADLSRFVPFPMIRREVPDAEELDVTIPRCPVRRAFGWHLTSVSLSFLLLHEMGHVLAGHLDSLVEGPSGWKELSASGRFASGVIPRRVIELDADTFAAFHGSLFDLSENRRSLIARTFPCEHLPPHLMPFIAHGISMSALFRLLTDEPVTVPSTPGFDEYPPPDVRSHLSMSRILAYAVEARVFDESDAPFVLRHAIQGVERAWDLRQMRGVRLGPPRDWRETIGDMTIRLFQEYRAFTPLLAKQSRLDPFWHQGHW
ncbi:MAG TPA: hypothetical protein PKE29_16695 [Phycisphaerales bacterium]|nr:hypothetical protein [Phycisphaerales bacterium]